GTLTWQTPQGASEYSLGKSGPPVKRQPWPFILIGVLFLVAMIALGVYLKRINSQLYTSPFANMQGLDKYFPMVRISRRTFLFRQRVVIFGDEGLAAFKKWRWRSYSTVARERYKRSAAW